MHPVNTDLVQQCNTGENRNEHGTGTILGKQFSSLCYAYEQLQRLKKNIKPCNMRTILHTHPSVVYNRYVYNDIGYRLKPALSGVEGTRMDEKTMKKAHLVMWALEEQICSALPVLSS